jgi:hypothetical protein
MNAEYTDTELAALPNGLIARAREAILSVRRYLDWYEVQAEITRVQAALQAGHRQLEQYIEDIDAGKPMARMPISMSEILRGGKYFWGLAAVRREANLLIGVYCNEVLGNDSPYKDDLAIKLFGKYASYENWQAAVAALEPPQPRQRKRKSVAGDPAARDVAVPAARDVAVPAARDVAVPAARVAGDPAARDVAVPAAQSWGVPPHDHRSASRRPDAGKTPTPRTTGQSPRAGGGTPPANAGEDACAPDASAAPTAEPPQGADEFSRVRKRPEPRTTNVQEPRRGGTDGMGESPRAGGDARVQTQGSGGSPVPKG